MISRNDLEMRKNLSKVIISNLLFELFLTKYYAS